MDSYDQIIYIEFIAKSKTIEGLVDDYKYEGIQKRGKSYKCNRVK